MRAAARPQQGTSQLAEWQFNFATLLGTHLAYLRTCGSPLHIPHPTPLTAQHGCKATACSHGSTVCHVSHCAPARPLAHSPTGASPTQGALHNPDWRGAGLYVRIYSQSIHFSVALFDALSKSIYLSDPLSEYLQSSLSEPLHPRLSPCSDDFCENCDITFLNCRESRDGPANKNYGALR